MTEQKLYETAPKSIEDSQKASKITYFGNKVTDYTVAVVYKDHGDYQCELADFQNLK